MDALIDVCLFPPWDWAPIIGVWENRILLSSLRRRRRRRLKVLGRPDLDLRR